MAQTKLQKLNQTPKIWLDLQLCENIYENFRNQLKFQEPLKSFDTRYPNRLESILGSVEQTFDGKLLYPTVLCVAASYFYKINCTHPFENGNKRMCILFTDAFLFFHNLEWRLPRKDMYELARFVADQSQNSDLEKQDVYELCKLIIADTTGERKNIFSSAIATLLRR
jgi:death on curing protein